MSNKQRRSLSHEDVELWAHVTRGVKRLKRAPRKAVMKADMKGVQAATEHKPEKKTPAPPAKMSKVKKPAPMRPGLPAATPPPQKTAAGLPLVGLEAKAKRRLNRGQSDVAARIDLHGMRQQEAHAALNRFLANAHANDARLVLVITGKGRTASDGAYAGEREVGILRRMVPHWLSEPALRHIVLGYESATARHGGEGAIYVRIRKAG